MRARALRIVSWDKILRFKNSFIMIIQRHVLLHLGFKLSSQPLLLGIQRPVLLRLGFKLSSELLLQLGLSSFFHKTPSYCYSFLSCCFTSTETTRTIMDGEPRTATSTVTQLLGSEIVQCCFTSTETIRTIRDGEPWTATSTVTQLLMGISSVSNPD